MPAEWEAHRGTWLAWPHNRNDWPGKFAPIPWVFAEVIRHVHVRERVRLIVQDSKKTAALLKRVGVDLSKVDFYRIPTDRIWMRDSAPTFVRRRDGKISAIHWRFNGWAKYADHKRDEKVGERIAAALHVPCIVPTVNKKRVVLEGGAIDVDGSGTLLATEECLLSDEQARNPELGREGIERVLFETLGVRKVVWLGRGIVGDDTHGHIDDLARFVGRGRVLLCQESNPRDENYALLQENKERLQGATDADGRRLEVIPLPMPAPLSLDGQRVPASYANFYIANGVVIVPTFNDPKDRIALGILAELFPDREVVGIHSVDLVWGLGTLHCMSQQEPS